MILVSLQIARTIKMSIKMTFSIIKFIIFHGIIKEGGWEIISRNYVALVIIPGLVQCILHGLIWNIFSFSGDLLLSGDGHSDWLSCAVFHPSGPRLATSSGDGTVKLWDYSKTVCLNTLTDHQQPGTLPL